MDEFCIIRIYLVLAVFRDESAVVASHLHVRHCDHVLTPRAHRLPVNTCITAYWCQHHFVHCGVVQCRRTGAGGMQFSGSDGCGDGSHRSLFSRLLDTWHVQPAQSSMMQQQQKSVCLPPAWTLSSLNLIRTWLALSSHLLPYGHNRQISTYLKHLCGSVGTHVLQPCVIHHTLTCG